MLALVLLLLAGCATSPQPIVGKVTTVAKSEPPEHPAFVIASADPSGAIPSVAEEILVTQLEQKMLALGYAKSESVATANVGVVYRYVYPSWLQITVLDGAKARELIRTRQPPSDSIIAWQGDAYHTAGYASRESLSRHLLDVLFLYYGKTVTDQPFERAPRPR